MKILFADQFSELGGAQLCLLDLLGEVVRHGWLAEVMLPGNGPLHHACAERGIRTLPLPLSSYSNGRKSLTEVLHYGTDTASSFRAIRDAAVRLDADLIYVNGPRALPAAVLAARERKTPVIYHAHSYLDRSYARQIARLCIVLGNVRVIAISGFVAKQFGSDSNSERLRTIYNGVAEHGFVPRPRNNPCSIGILGRISPEKGHLDFVRTAKQMLAARPHLRFIVFGAALFADGFYEGEVRRAAEGLPVEFRGWTENVPGALHEIDILAVPSGPAEGATRVILEAFSSGTPVVAYPSGGIPELVRHGETGLLTGAPEAQALAGTLSRLLDDPAMMAKLSTLGRREWEARFQTTRCLSDVISFIEEGHRPATAISATPKSTIANRSGTADQGTAHGGGRGAA